MFIRKTNTKLLDILEAYNEIEPLLRSVKISSEEKKHKKIFM